MFAIFNLPLIRAFFRVIRGQHGAFTDLVFLSPWWARPQVRTVEWSKLFFERLKRFVTMAPFFHVLSGTLLLLALLLRLTLNKGIMVTTTATLVGLSSIAVAVMTVMASNLQGYVRWLWLAFEDSGIRFALFFNLVLIVISSSGSKTQSLALAFIAWVQLFRSLYVALQLFGPKYSMTSRVQEFARDHFDRSLPKYEQRLFPLGFPRIKVQNSFWLRVRLAESDMRVITSVDATSFRKTLKLTDDGQALELIISGKGDQTLIENVNAILHGQFTRSSANERPLQQMEKHARWFSENATQAAKQHCWVDFEDMIEGYAYLARQACLAIDEPESFKVLLGSMTYTWNAPTEAFEYGISSAPTIQAQKNCRIMAALFYYMDVSAQSVHDYVDLIALPTIRAVLFSRSLSDIDVVGESLGQALQGALLRYLGREATLTAFFVSGRVLESLVKYLRILQASFSHEELVLRQWVGLNLLNELVRVGSFRQNGVNSCGKNILKDHVEQLLIPAGWTKLIGYKEIDEDTLLVLNCDAQRTLREIFGQVQGWTTA